MRNLVNLVDGNARLVEAEADGVNGKVACVFFAAEALLLGRGNQFAVDDQRSGGVHALRDAVLALVQARPMRLLEGHRVFQPADSDDLHSCSHATDAPRKFRAPGHAQIAAAACMLGLDFPRRVRFERRPSTHVPGLRPGPSQAETYMSTVLLTPQSKHSLQRAESHVWGKHTVQ